jgi:hypothetical protein
LSSEDHDKQYNAELTALGTEDEDKQYNDELTVLGKEDGEKQSQKHSKLKPNFVTDS